MSGDRTDKINLGHGSGGRLTEALVKDVFHGAFGNPTLHQLDDAGLCTFDETRLAFACDAFVVSPLVFPGGNIGSLSVYGTANDLAVCGAVPRYLTASFILEEGLSVALLRDIAKSMAGAAQRCGVTIVAGDTKVVEKGKGDGVYVSTSGIGLLYPGLPADHPVGVGDVVLCSGYLGDHGAVIAAARTNLELRDLVSDCGPVGPCVQALFEAGIRPRFMRDPSCGGLVTVLAEICASVGGISFHIAEDQLPVRASVRSICGILGLDPLYLACEGRLIAVVAEAESETALAALRSVPEGTLAAQIGTVIKQEPAPVVLHTKFGGTRLYDRLASEPLPRIC